jgi:catechol 2,3-dioxygenase-like lactoylglutathione lyase family enzyme
MRALLILALSYGCLWAETHFHHLSLNVTDPEAAISFYTSRFDCARAGPDAVQAGRARLFFRKVKRAPAAAIESAIWHFGWGAEDMPKAYAEQLSRGTVFDTPLTDISDLARSPNFYYAYVRGPDGAPIELNTASHHRFGHLHLLSADPVAAGLWWAKHFGVAWPPEGRAPSREARFYKGFQVGPTVSFVMDGVNVIIFPVEYLRGPKELVSTRGRVVDHVGLTVDDLDGTLRRLRRDGVRTLSGVKKIGGMRSVMIEGPDRMAIQLVEDREGRRRCHIEQEARDRMTCDAVRGPAGSRTSSSQQSSNSNQINPAATFTVSLIVALLGFRWFANARWPWNGRALNAMLDARQVPPAKQSATNSGGMSTALSAVRLRVMHRRRSALNSFEGFELRNRGLAKGGGDGIPVRGGGCIWRGVPRA